MSVKRKKKVGRKPSRSTLTKEQRQAKTCKKFLAHKKKQMAKALSDKLHVMMVESDLTYVNVYFDDGTSSRHYGTFKYAEGLLRNFYFRTVNKGARVNMLYFLEFKNKENLVFMVLRGKKGKKKEVLLDADHTKNIKDLQDLLLQPRYLQTKKKI